MIKDESPRGRSHNLLNIITDVSVLNPVPVVEDLLIVTIHNNSIQPDINEVSGTETQINS